MKKFLLLAILLLSLTTVMAQTKLRGPINYNAEGYVEVYYPEQLETAIRYNNSAKIKLMADIDVSHIRRICKTFTGSITGKHKEYSEELKDSVDAMYCLDGGRGKGGEKSWLFCSVENATFDHILFKNFRIEDDDYCSIGVIAKYAENSKFTNLAFENVSVFDNFDDAGVIAGHAEGCQFEKILTKFCDVTVDGECVGGLVGWSKNSIYTTCIISVTSAVYADGKVCWAHSGGIVGESQHDTFKECINMGLVGGRADKLGGIASSSDDSKFISCSNFNAVYFCKEADFRKAVDQIRERIKSLTPEDINKMGESYFKTIGIVGTSTFVGTFGLPLLAGTIYLCDAPALLGVLFALKTLAIIALAAAAIAVLAAVTAAIIMALTDYDEVGGICGCAEYSSFEGCVNSGTLYCDDSECGGIVGRAKGGTINNCLNTGKPNNDGEMSLGSIVGAVVCQTKITNCFSTQDAPIIGVGKIRGLVNLYSTPKDVSAESGNNYRLKNGNSNKLSCYEMQVTKEQMEDGTVALWLNNGAGNRNLPIKPWRQNLTGERDHFPILDKTHNEVKPKDLKHKAIRCEQDLREFAKMVNDGEQFYNAVLENDIKMSSNVWTPIGTKAHRWRGVFDGQGHTISGLKCSVADNSEEGAGLFGTVDVHADIRNVTLDASCEIEHKSSKHANAYGAGAIVGNVRNDRRGWGNVLIRGCGNYGKVTTSHHAGGILGRVINDGNDGDGSHVCIVVDSCFNAGEITAEGNSGLLCGYMQNYGIVYNCWSKGSLKQKGNNRVFDANNSRGEAEYFIGFDKTINITNCYDYQSKVDWNNLAADKRRQQGVEIVTNSALAHTVKFFAGNGTCATTSLTEANVRAGVILPVVTPLDGWTFAGWSKEMVETETDIEPTTFVRRPGWVYKPAEDISLYAVYSKDIIVDNKPMTIYNTFPESISVIVGTEQYSSLYYSDKNLVVPEGLEAITASVTSDNNIVQKVSYKSGMVIPKGEAVVLHATKTLMGETSFPFAVTMIETEKVSDNLLIGTDTEKMIPTDNILICNPIYITMGMAKYAGVDYYINGAHKAYLAVPYAAAKAPAYAPRLFAEGSTSINNAVEETENSGIVYNHMGNRVNSNYRGIVIVNGKKVMKSR